jgi:long-chain acyl-CoA synthetase
MSEVATPADALAHGPVHSGPPLVIPEGSLGRWFVERAAEYADRPAALVREGDQFVPLTYAALEADARAVAGGLLEHATPGDRVAIRANSRYEWSVVDLACALAGLVSVPLYPSFSVEQTAFVLADADVRLLVTEDESPALGAVERVFDIEALPRAETATFPGLEVLPEETVTIVYTSGTTGRPKGVDLTHRNLLAQAAQEVAVLPRLDASFVTTCFLPLSHIYQRLAAVAVWAQGGTLAYMNSTDLLAELRMVRPQVIPSVPRVYRRLWQGIQEEVAGMGGVRRRLVSWALDVAVAYGLALERGHVPGSLRRRHGLAESLVYARLRERLGLDRVAYAVTAAASIDATVLYAFHGLGVPLLEGYGTTETTAGVTFNPMGAFRAGTVGVPFPGVELTLALDGEVLVWGPNVMRGYWNDPVATAQAFVGGWYHTGDVGEWDGEYLRIVDRKDQRQVLDTGRNVFPTPVENALRRSPYITEAMVVAEGRKYVAALIQPNYSLLVRFAAHEGIRVPDDTLTYDPTGAVTAVPEWLLDHDDVRALFEAEVATANRSLADFERVRRFTLLAEALSMDREELTPILKKRRDTIESRYGTRIEALFVA